MSTKKVIIYMLCAVIIIGWCVYSYLIYEASNTFDKYNSGKTTWYCSSYGITIIYDNTDLTAYLDSEPDTIYLVDQVGGGVSKTWRFAIEAKKSTVDYMGELTGEYKMQGSNKVKLTVSECSASTIAKPGTDLIFEKQ